MADYSGLIAKLNNKADEIDKLEAVFMRLSVSRVANPDKVERIAANIITLIPKVQEILNKRIKVDGEMTAEQEKEASEIGQDVVQSFLDFAFKHERDLIFGIIADIFDIDIEDVANVPISCIFRCIICDKVLQTFFPRWAVLEARMQSDMSPNAAPFQVSPPIPFISNPNGKKSLTGATSNASS